MGLYLDDYDFLDLPPQKPSKIKKYLINENNSVIHGQYVFRNVQKHAGPN